MTISLSDNTISADALYTITIDRTGGFTPATTISSTDVLYLSADLSDLYTINLPLFTKA
jgi:hypothetical protein